MSDTAREKIIVALDVPSRSDAEAVLLSLRGRITWCKIGMELFTREGPDVVRAAIDTGAHVFLDLKFHDIPNTVAAGIRAACALRVKMVTIHASGGPEMMRAAVDAAADTETLVLAVTVLTSSDRATLAAIGLDVEPAEQVLRLADAAHQSGIQGLVCSPLEIDAIRERFQSDFTLVTPGVRPTGSDPGDQKRILSPSEAIRAGANYLVIGRPILGASDRAAAFDAIEREIDTVLE